jgi:hypothetical protein
MPQRLEFYASCLALAAFVVAIAGCGGVRSEQFVPVAGTVTVGGKPLTTGSVTFHPDAGKDNTSRHIPVGTIDEQGGYKLSSATNDGAPPGWYKVTVTAQAPIDPMNPYAPPKHLISPKFADANTSGLEIEVVASPAPGAYDLKLGD